jgi:Carboxypeptidase regulatory-like domain/TonB dependent receptor
MNRNPISMRLLVFAAAASLALFPAICLAQSAGTGTIVGTVTDTTGALVPNAEVSIKDTDTGAVRTLTTNSDGYYTAPSLQSGHYEVIIGGGAFGKVDSKNLVLTVGQILTVDAALPVGAASTEITVTDTTPALDPNKVEVSQTLSQNVVSNLPVNGRRYDNFVLLTPNVVPDGSSGLISYRGISGLYNSNLVDGTSNQQAFFSEARGRSINTPYVYSQDSIKEFASSASGYSAELGQAAGGQINAITKSGTNDLHGDLFYYLRYPSWNALDPFAKYTGRVNNNPFLLTPTVHQQQQFGGSIGGAIIKDKLFGFFTYDGYRKVNPILYTSSIPGATILAYATTTPSATCPAGVTYQQCFTAAQFIVNNLTAVGRNLKQDIFFPRLDYQLNGRNHLSGQFLWENYHQPNGYNSALTANNSSASQNGTANFHERILIANWESVITPNSVNALHFQWGRDLETDSANAPGPAVSLSGLFAYGMSLALPRGAFPDEHRWQVADVYTLSHGKHNIKVGADLNFIHEQLANLFQGNGNYSYSGANAAANFGSWVQDVYGLNGSRHYSSFTQVNDPITHVGADDFWNKNLAGFAEDAWKISPRLLVNAGLRYDVQLIPQPPHPYTTSYNGVASPLGNFYTKTININYKMLQPRFGFSWNPQPGTVVRGGYGMFYGLISNSIYYTTRVENGVYQQQYNITSPAASNAINAPNVLFTPPGPPLAAPFAGAATPTIASGGGLLPLSLRGLDPKFTNPYTHSFDLAVEQELPYHSTLTLAYVGTRGLRLPYNVDVNQNAPTTTRTYDIVNSAGTTTSTVTVPFTPIGTPRPSPNDGSILVGFSGINSWYHSGAFTFKKPFNHGLELLLNYTWSHAMDMSQVAGGSSTQNTGGGTFQGTNVILDPFNIKGHYSGNINMTGEYGRSDLDVRGRFVGSVVYSPVVELDMPAWAKLIINGWSISGTYTAQSGTPLVSLMSGTLSGAFAGLNGGATGEAVTLNNAPGPGRAPFLKRNNAVYPGVHNADARIARTFPIHEKVKFEVFGEVFNIANHRYVASVNGSAFQYVNPAATGTCSNLVHSNVCIAPFTSTPFGAPTATSGVLYGARQLQIAGKLFF